jgi:hypothetical protein
MCDECLRVLTARAYGPRERLRVAEETGCDVHVGHHLVALSVLGPNDVDSREHRRDHREQACVSDVTARADPAAEAEARRARVAYARVELAIEREVPLRLEGLGIGVVLGVVQDGP